MLHTDMILERFEHHPNACNQGLEKHPRSFTRTHTSTHILIPLL